MKQYLFLLLVFVSGLVNAQSVDSTRIPQTITLQQKYHSYLLGFARGSWGQPDMINYLNAYVAQRDSGNWSKPITITVPSGLVRDLFQLMSSQPEGQSTQYNENINSVLGAQLTNPWLGAALYGIQKANWAARDARVVETDKELGLIKKQQ